MGKLSYIISTRCESSGEVCSIFKKNWGWILNLGGGFKYVLYFHAYLGKWSNLTDIF